MSRDDCVGLDFETYSEANLKVVGTFRYAEDPSTEALILAYRIGYDEPIGVDLTLPDAFSKLSPLFDAIHRGARVCAHNAQFERCIWEKACSFPITPRAEQWDCTAVRSRLLAMPGSLDGCAEALGVPTRKDKRGMELINMFSKPQLKSRGGGRILPADRPEEFAEFVDYCKQDVRVEATIDKILPPIPDNERDAFSLDYTINDRGIPIDTVSVDRAAKWVSEYSVGLVERAVEISGYRPTQREKTLAFLEERGHKLPNLQAATVEKLAQKDGLDPEIKELLGLRIELSRAGTKKLKTLQECVSADGRLRGSFMFSAASTRRWSSKGVQVHNLQKPEGETNQDVVMELLEADMADTLPIMFNGPLTAMAQSIRGFLHTSTNFLVADYASVEPRGLAWSANEQWLLDAYWKGQDVYKEMAGRVYNTPSSQVDASGRFMGKQLVLGCGYGMGPPRFQQSVKGFGAILTDDEARKAVYGYRESVPEIIRFWRAVEKACILALKTGNVQTVTRFKFRPETLPNGFSVLYVDMPGGTIAYPAPFLGQEEWNGYVRDTFNFYTPLGSKWVETDTFGGSITENIIQALCRDVLRDGLVAADKAGHYVIAHVHDEAIAETDNPNDLEDFEHRLSNSSPWAEGFPIATEGFVSNRYKK